MSAHARGLARWAAIGGAGLLAAAGFAADALLGTQNPRGPVTDLVHILGPEEQASLRGAMDALYTNTGTRVFVVTDYGLRDGTPAETADQLRRRWSPDDATAAHTAVILVCLDPPVLWTRLGDALAQRAGQASYSVPLGAAVEPRLDRAAVRTALAGAFNYVLRATDARDLMPELAFAPEPGPVASVVRPLLGRGLGLVLTLAIFVLVVVALLYQVYRPKTAAPAGQAYFSEPVDEQWHRLSDLLDTRYRLLGDLVAALEADRLLAPEDARQMRDDLARWPAADTDPRQIHMANHIERLVPRIRRVLARDEREPALRGYARALEEWRAFGPQVMEAQRAYNGAATAFNDSLGPVEAGNADPLVLERPPKAPPFEGQPVG